MKRILLALGLLIGSIGSAFAACTSPVVMHDFPGTAFNMSVLTAPDGNCATASAVQTWAGGTLGAMANYGTSPGAVLVPGVNAFITNTPSMAPSGLAAWGLVAAGQNGATPTNGQLAMGQFNTTPTSITSGNVSPLQLDANGNMKVNVVAGGAGGGAVTMAASAVSAGAFVSGAALDGWDATQGAKADAVCATATGTCSVTSLLKYLNTAAGSPTPAGTNVIGKVGIDQTTPGTTNLVALAANQSVNLAQVNGASVPVGSGVQATAQRMTLATDSPGIVTLGQALAAASVPVVLPTAQITTLTPPTSVGISGTLPAYAATPTFNCGTGCGSASDTTAALSGMTANNAATQIALVGTNSVSVLLSGTWTATLTPEVSADGGTTWVATQFWNVNTHAAAATVSANGTYDILGTGGKSQARVRISAFTSGTVTGNLKATSQSPSTTDGLATLNTSPTPAGSNVIGKVGIDQTTPGTTNLVALAANQSMNQTQINGVAVSTGSGVLGTGTQRMALATDSPGIVTLGQTTKSASVPFAIASDQVGTAGTANATVTTVQGIASMTPLVANPTNGYPSGAIAETASATGTTAATTATLATAVGKTTYICGFSMRSVATAAAAGNATVTGTITGTLNFTHGTGVTPTVIPNDQRFSPCIPASTTNTSIAVVSPAAGTGGVMSVTAWGFQL